MPFALVRSNLAPRLALRVLVLLAGASACDAALAQERRQDPSPAAIAPAGGEVQTIDLVQTAGKISPHRLALAPGRYVFRVHAEDVGHPVGFEVARMTPELGVGEEVPGAQLPAPLSAGQTGTTAVVELQPGKYTYRSHANPTPNYFLTVK